MTIEITDTGPGGAKINVAAKRQASSGIGLRNTRDRLQAFYGDSYEFNPESAADGGFRVEIKLPLDS
jgi:sensor histidine kinase YesM